MASRVGCFPNILSISFPPPPAFKHVIRSFANNQHIVNYFSFREYKKLHYEGECARLENEHQRTFKATVKKIESKLSELFQKPFEECMRGWADAFFSACHEGAIAQIVASIEHIPLSVQREFYEWVLSHNIQPPQPIQWEQIIKSFIDDSTLSQNQRDEIGFVLMQLTIQNRCAALITQFQGDLSCARPLPLRLYYPCLFKAFFETETEGPDHEMYETFLTLLLDDFRLYDLKSRNICLQGIFSHPKSKRAPFHLHIYKKIYERDPVFSLNYVPPEKFWHTYPENEQIEIVQNIISSLHLHLCSIQSKDREAVQEERRLAFIERLISQLKPLQESDGIALATLWNDLYALHGLAHMLYPHFESHITGFARALARHCGKLENIALYLLLQGIEEEETPTTFDTLLWMNRFEIIRSWNFEAAIRFDSMHLEECLILRSGFPREGASEAKLFIHALSNPGLFTYRLDRDSVVVALLKRVYSSEEGRQTLTPHIPRLIVREHFRILAQFADLDFSP